MRQLYQEQTKLVLNMNQVADKLAQNATKDKQAAIPIAGLLRLPAQNDYKEPNQLAKQE
jgi:hypothetical protein